MITVNFIVGSALVLYSLYHLYQTSVTYIALIMYALKNPILSRNDPKFYAIGWLFWIFVHIGLIYFGYRLTAG